MSDSFSVLPCFIEISVCNANSVDLDQTPRYMASDLGQYCLSMSLLWDARHKWVKCNIVGKKAAYGHPALSERRFAEIYFRKSYILRYGGIFLPRDS